MSRQTDGGKGDTPRPTDSKKYEENWERIFGKKSNKKDENEEQEKTEQLVIDIINAQAKCT